MDTNELKAKAVFEIWAHWMRYYLPRHLEGKVTDADLLRWQHLAHSDFSELPESAKQSDRQIAALYLADFITPQDLQAIQGAIPWYRSLLHRLGIHWWTPFQPGRMCGGTSPSDPVYQVKVRRCRICPTQNEEIL